MISDDSKGCSAAGIARRSGVRGLLAVALLFVAAASAAGRIEYAHVVVDDRPLIEMTQPFGFGSRGHMDIELRDISLWRRHGAAAEGTGGATAAPQLSRFGFILASMLPDAAFIPPPVSEGAPASEAAPCALDAAELKLFTFAGVWAYGGCDQPPPLPPTRSWNTWLALVHIFRITPLLLVFIGCSCNSSLCRTRQC
jgi:hypothetical protein